MSNFFILMTKKMLVLSLVMIALLGVVSPTTGQSSNNLLENWIFFGDPPASTDIPDWQQDPLGMWDITTKPQDKVPRPPEGPPFLNAPDCPNGPAEGCVGYSARCGSHATSPCRVNRDDPKLLWQVVGPINEEHNNLDISGYLITVRMAVARINIYGSDNPDGPWTLIDAHDLDHSTDGWVPFGYQVTLSQWYSYYKYEIEAVLGDDALGFKITAVELVAGDVSITPTPTDEPPTFTPTPTDMPTPEPTDTPVPGETATATPTDTPGSTPTATPTSGGGRGTATATPEETTPPTRG